MEEKNLSDYREEIDAADKTLLAAFVKRMEVSAHIAEYKRVHGMQILDAARESEKLARVAAAVPDAMGEYAQTLYSLLFSLSRDYQKKCGESAEKSDM